MFLACVGAAATLSADPPPPRPYHVSHYDVAIQPDFAKHVIFGAVTITLTALAGPLTHVELDAVDITVFGCSQGKVHLRYVLAAGVLRVELPQPLRDGQHTELRIVYRAVRTRGLVFFDDQFYTLSATRYWLPCNDRLIDRATFHLVVVTPERFQVVASGTVIHESVHDGQRKTEWREDRPIPTFALGVAAGLFRFESRQAGKTPLRIALAAPTPVVAGHSAAGLSASSSEAPQPQAAAEPPSVSTSARLEATVLEDTASALAFFEQVAGVSYPAGSYTSVFAHGDVVGAGRRFALLPEAYLSALDKDPTDLWLVADELAHQWWGIGVSSQDYSDFWLDEGVCTFLADAFLEKRFGKARYDKELSRSRKVFEDLVASGDSRPLHFTAWSLPQEAVGPVAYHKGALFLNELRTELGDSVFWPAFRTFTRAYMDQSVTSEQFQASMERGCRCDLKVVFREWVYF